MKTIKDFLDRLKKVLAKDSRYKLEAYNFVLSALNFTVDKLSAPRHVTARELLLGIKEYGREQFGPMTLTVFEHWGITSTDDLGNIVFNLIEVELLGKTPEDKIEDFHDVYDFKKAFSEGIEYRLEDNLEA